MKVQIISLDPHDDRASAMDKLGWVQAPRALLVWPRRGEILSERLDLALLQRQADRRRVQLGLVTHDPVVREHAFTLGIPVFDSADHISEDGWRRARRPKPISPRTLLERASSDEFLAPPARTAEISSARTRGLAIALLAIAGLALLTAFAPWAEVVIQPETNSVTRRLTLIFDTGVEKPTAQGAVPAREVSAQVTGDVRVETTGSVSFPSAFATGEVVFVNLTSEPVTLPAGTGLRASRFPEARFETSRPISLPGQVGAERTVLIRATTGGPAGNLPALAIDSVEGLLGIQVSARNLQATEGGRVERRPAVAERDFARAEEVLLEALMTDAIHQVRLDLQDGEVLLLPLQVAEVLSRTFNQDVDAPAESLSLMMLVEFRALAYFQEVLEQSAGLSLESRLPRGWEPVPGSLTFGGLDVGPLSGATAGGTIEVTAATFQPVEVSLVQETIRATRPSRVPGRLEAATRLGLIQMRLFPGWWPQTPFLTQRIFVLYPWEVSP